MSEGVIMDKLDRFADVASKFEGLISKIPRFVEMLGVSFFAGRASERLGGSFADGALGGAVADGLAHSQLPNNQIGGVALAVYLASVGLLNIVPSGQASPDFIDAGGTVIGPENVFKMPSTDKVIESAECVRLGGTIIRPITGTSLVVCRLGS